MDNTSEYIIPKKPKIKLKYGDDYKFVQNVVSDNKLNTVCEEARCPNIYECWGRGTATITVSYTHLPLPTKA